MNIFRWTIGNTTRDGYDCLEASIRNMLRLYRERFDYYICYNNANIQLIREIVGHRPIKLVKQTWDECPIPISYDGNCDSTLWKYCPARLNINAHEIVCDNDIVLVQRFKEIDEFLQSDKVLLTQDPIKYQGKFRHLFQPGEKYNAGLVGLPPGYDFQKALCEVWAENDSPDIIGAGDEQGLTTATLKREKFIEISKERLLLVHSEGSTIYHDYDPVMDINNFTFEPVVFHKHPGYHFVQINKRHHLHWEIFKQKRVRPKL